jgi:hypothetical protein
VYLHIINKEKKKKRKLPILKKKKNTENSVGKTRQISVQLLRG